MDFHPEAPGLPSFEMSCSFAVQVLAQLNFLRILMRTKAYKNNVHLLPKKLEVGFRARVIVVCTAGFGADPERRVCHCLSQLFGVAALAHRGLPPCRGFVREVPLAFPAPHLHALGL